MTSASPDEPPGGTAGDKLRCRIAEEAARILSHGGVPGSTKHTLQIGRAHV